MKHFTKADIEIVSIEKLPSGNTVILYQPILDSLYYCPGANIRHDGDREKVSFVRCGIKEKCIVALAAERTDQGKLKIVVQSSPEKIDLVYGDGEFPLIR